MMPHLSNLHLRTLTAIVLLSLFYFIFYLGSPWIEALFLLSGSALLYEAYIMAKKEPRLYQAILMTYLFFGALGLYDLAQSERLLFYGILSIIVSNDIGAYLSGRIIGGPKLLPKISPKKTWAGFIGGLLCAVLFMIYAFPEVVSMNKPLLPLWTVLLIACVGNMGDLLESAVKRRAGVKDSGTILPGHGGIFDRLDSLVCVGALWMLFQLFSGAV